MAGLNAYGKPNIVDVIPINSVMGLFMLIRFTLKYVFKCFCVATACRILNVITSVTVTSSLE